MADTNVISGVEVGNSYSATGHTEHYNLPIYNATDKVSFLVDWNGAMREIDGLLYQVKSTGEVSEQQILALQTALETAQTTIKQITINIDTLTHDLGDVSADNTELHNRVDTLDTNYTELSSLIASMQTLVNNLSTQVSSLDDAVNQIGDIADQAQSDVASLSARPIPIRLTAVATVGTSPSSGYNEVSARIPISEFTAKGVDFNKFDVINVGVTKGASTNNILTSPFMGTFMLRSENPYVVARENDGLNVQFYVGDIYVPTDSTAYIVAYVVKND